MDALSSEGREPCGYQDSQLRRGQLVRTLDLGHRDAGVHASRFRAAYWDGKNEAGEKIASGLYFYSITAGDFSAMRKMIVKK